MPVQHVQDDSARRLRVTATDPVTAGDFISSVERQFLDGAWSYGLLVDARTLANPPPAAGIQAFVHRVLELTAAHGPRGPVAIVARQSAMISAAHKYVYFGGNSGSEVFWDLADAEHWLSRQMAESRP